MNFLKERGVIKSIEIETVFSKIEMKINEALIFFKIVSLAFNTLIIPASFGLVEAPLKIFF